MNYSTSVAVPDAPSSTSPGEERFLPSDACGLCDVMGLTSDLDTDWEAYVDAHPEATLFHGCGWRDAVRDTFSHEALYLLAVRGGRVVGVLPLFLVASRLAGRMLVSVPYGVGGGILADDDDAAAALFLTAKQLAGQRRCNSIDLRSERAVVPGLPTVDRYVGFRRLLPPKPGDVLGWLPRKARAAARNARRKHRLTASFGDGQLREVWRLYSMTMRRLGSLSYPLAFWERLLDATPDRHWVSVVSWRGKAVAGLVTFLFRDRVMPYFFGATDEARRCSAANFAYLMVMERGVASGHREFDFGRSRRDNTGSCDFKRFNGFEPRPLSYQIYTAAGAVTPDLSPDHPKYRMARKVWKRLPLCVTRLAGARLARHIPG